MKMNSFPHEFFENTALIMGEKYLFILHQVKMQFHHFQKEILYYAFGLETVQH